MIEINGLFDGEPQFVNEIGVKWWCDQHTTQYAQRPDRNGITLDVVCFGIEEPSGRRTRVLVTRDQKVIEEDQNLESLAVKIDIRKFLIYDHKQNPQQE